MKFSGLIAALSAVILSAGALDVRAATVSSSFIDANTLVISTTGTVSLIQFDTFFENTARAFDTNLNSLDVTASFLGPTTVTVPGAGFATAGDPNGPFALASADLGLLDAISKQGVVFNISGTGSVTASVDFSIALDEPGFPAINFGAANLFIEFYELSGSPFASAAVADTVDLIAFQGSGMQVLNGTLTTTIQIPSTNEFSILAVFGDVQAQASVVPTPAAVWLFGSALGLMGWMRQRQRA